MLGAECRRIAYVQYKISSFTAESDHNFPPGFALNIYLSLVIGYKGISTTRLDFSIKWIIESHRQGHKY